MTLKNPGLYVAYVASVNGQSVTGYVIMSGCKPPRDLKALRKIISSIEKLPNTTEVIPVCFQGLPDGTEWENPDE